LKIFPEHKNSEALVTYGCVIAYGLSSDEVTFVKEALPNNDSKLYIPSNVNDILALPCDTLIVDAESICASDRKIIIDYYTELGSSFDESVFWIGYPKPPSHLRGKFKCLQNFGELRCVIHDKLIKAHNKVKRTRPFSKNLSDCLLILSIIRSHPGIKSQELSEKLELPLRTVQRHIATLQATGEWIEYDTQKRGWYLQYGVSILFGDHLK